jgi:hypothetical protein
MSSGAPPLEPFRRLLRRLFMDNTVDEAFALWRYNVEHVPHLAQEDLDTLDTILAAPPPDLVEIMEQDGWIHLTHTPDSATLIPYTHDEYVEWLRDITTRMRADYDAGVGAR